MDGQEAIIQAVRELISPLVASADRFEARFNRLEERFDALETRFDTLEARFDRLEERFDRLEARFDVLEARFDRLEERFDRLEARFESVEHRLARVETNQLDAIERLKLLEQQVTLGFDSTKEDTSLQRKSVYALPETTQRHKSLLEEEIDQLRQRVAALESKQAA